MSDRYARAVAVYQQTSREAWRSVLGHLSIVDAEIIEYIGTRDGAISEEIEHGLGYKHQTVSAQIRHLVEAGLLAASEETRKTASGRRAIVWILPLRPALAEPALVQGDLF